MNRSKWSTALKSFAQLQRKVNPIPNRATLTDEEEWHCRIIGGEFMNWYQRGLPNILAQRAALRMMEFDPEPIIVFTTTTPGLVAAKEIMSSPPERLVYLLHGEFGEWEEQNPVDTFTFHVRHWSYVRQPERALLGRALEAYPDVNASEYRVHSSGDLWGKQCGVEVEHLWRWDGDEMELLEEAFSRVVF